MPSPQDIENLQERLAAHRATLATLLTQQANHGSANAPPAVAFGIREARTGIHHAKATLRTWGVSVEDLSDDAALPAPPPEPPAPLRLADIPSPTGAARPLRVFLCHASEDKPAVRQLYGRLRAAGVTPWLDTEDLLPGQRWQVEIPRAVRESDIVLVCLSQRSVTKAGYVQKELAFALDVAEQQPEDAIYLIPLRLEACEAPERLRHLHWVDLFADDGVDRLLRALRARAVGVGALPPVAPPAAPTEESPPAPDLAAIPRLWQQARTAFLTQQWARAEVLLAQVAALNPAYQDVQARLAEARRLADLQRRYDALSPLRIADLWEEVLVHLAALTDSQPDAPDPQAHRAWAEGRQRREQRYEAALGSVERAVWPEAIRELESLLAEVPDDAEATALLAHAHARQIAEAQRHAATAQARQAAEAQRRQRERLAPVVAQMQAGAFDQALAHLDALLVKAPTDHEATALAARIIETPAAPFAERLRAAELVGRVGDPRIPVAAEQWRAELTRRNTDFGKPAGYWCYVREGAYRIGGWASSEPSATIQIPAFWIARYPITVAQYAPFVAEGYGNDAERWWNSEGWAWRQKSQRTQPWDWDRPESHRPNQPVIGVTWYEVTAFCAWLSAQMADVLPTGYVLRLPTEAEWEAAAAYDGSGQRRLYPWGDADPTPDLAIYDSGGQKKLSSVGCCPAGASACGALDLVGNVWELAASEYQAYPAGSHQPQKDFTDGRTAWRGGSWYNDSSYVRCGARGRYSLDVDDDSYGFRVVLAPRLGE